MMILEDGLRKWLVSMPAVVQMFTLQGIFLGSVPEGSPDPSMCITKITATPGTTFDGPSGYNIRRYQFSFYSKTQPQVLMAQELIRTQIDGFSGVLPNGQRVFNIIRDNELDGYDDVTDEHRSITDYFIHFLENTGS